MKRKRDTAKMEDFSNVLVNTSEFIPGRLYFVSLNTDSSPKSTASAHYFAVDTEQFYDSFYNDFGPLNLAILFHYCGKLDRKLSNSSMQNKKIIHYTGTCDKNRVNAAFLIGAYAVIKLAYDPDAAYEVLTRGSKKEYLEFRDASVGDPYTLSLLDCLKAVKKAVECGFFNFSSFDFFEYEHYERVENGDLNWILPDKFLAFCGPHHKSAIDRGYPIHAPETYFAYFRRHNVTTVIRLNKKAYDSNRFIQAGFEHKDLFFVDGGIPNDRILARFISICENAKGAVAVHCKAGLGRTGTLIACYIMKHYRFTAQEAIAWIRICRPGSIIAHQQTWLAQKQKQLWTAGEEYRQKLRITAPVKHSKGIYALPSPTSKAKANENVTGIMKKVDLMEIHDKDQFKSEENKITQGDRLNQIKAQKAKAKQTMAPNGERKTFRSKVIVNAATTASVRVGRLITNTTKSTTSTTRVLTKRNDVSDSQTVRRCSQRKINASLMLVKEKTIETKKRENFSWLVESGGLLHECKLEKCSKEVKVETTVKRSKRTLNMDKDKASPHSIKVSRRSHVQLLKDGKKSDGKLHLPSVKTNKTI